VDVISANDTGIYRMIPKAVTAEVVADAEFGR